MTESYFPRGISVEFRLRVSTCERHTSACTAHSCSNARRNTLTEEFATPIFLSAAAPQVTRVSCWFAALPTVGLTCVLSAMKIKASLRFTSASHSLT